MSSVTYPNTNLSMLPLGFGMVSFGMADWGDVIDKLLGQFHDGGGRLIDTAHCYSFWKPDGAGASESCLGDYLKRTGRRDWIISTKGGHPGAANYRTIDAYLSPERISADLDDSIARLRIDTIDIYFLHRDDLRMKVEEIIEPLNREIKKGRIKHIGASNWKCERIEAANAYAASKGLNGFVVSQPQWCLAERVNKPAADAVCVAEPEVAWHTQSKLAMMPYNGASQGYFATNGERGAKGFDTPNSRARLGRVQQLAAEMGKTPNQIALAWLINHPFPVTPLITTKNAEHLADALGATNIQLTPLQLKWLRDG